MKKINIAIDGHSSCGKSTLAKAMAKELNYLYIDTGAMYRAVTLFCLQHGIIGEDGFDESILEQRMDEIDISFGYDSKEGISKTVLNGQDVEHEIRKMEVASHVSQISSVPFVREKLVELQRKIGEGLGVVMDGRDIGTVVFPEAPLKLFLTARPEIRAERRYKELIEKGEQVTFEDVLENLQQRDKLDSEREVSPLRQADDAIILDNSDLTRDEQFKMAMDYATKVLAN